MVVLLRVKSSFTPSLSHGGPSRRGAGYPQWILTMLHIQGPSLAEVSPHLAQHRLFSNLTGLSRGFQWTPQMTGSLFSSCRDGRWEKADPISSLATLHRCLFNFTGLGAPFTAPTRVNSLKNSPHCPLLG